MVIMTHFIDGDWNFHQKNFENFCQIANHKGDTIGRTIKKCIERWYIDRHFTVIFDDATSNKGAIAYLVTKFRPKMSWCWMVNYLQ